MKYERDFEDGILPQDAHEKAEKMRTAIPYEQFTAMYKRFQDAYPEGYEAKLEAQKVADFYKNRGQFDVALREVAFDMVMEDPNVVTLPKEHMMKRLEVKLKDFALDEKVRSKYAGMVR